MQLVCMRTYRKIEHLRFQIENSKIEKNETSSFATNREMLKAKKQKQKQKQGRN